MQLEFNAKAKNNKNKTKRVSIRVLQYTTLISVAIIMIIPMIPVIFGSFKTNTEYYNTSVWAFPKNFFNFENYKIAFTDGNMLLGFGNTLLIMVFSITISVMIGAMTAYVLSRFKFKGKKIINSLFMFAILLPSITLNIAIFSLMTWINNNLGIQLINTRLSGIILFAGTDIISIYIFIQYIQHIPTSLDESALIDGSSYFGIFFKIILPLLLPAISTVIILKFVAIYNDFYIPNLYMPKKELAVISTALNNFTGPFGSRWEVICAGQVITMVPVLALFIGLQKFIYGGLVMGSVKE